jgi:lipid-binding SYLF domain-containing protein
MTGDLILLVMTDGAVRRLLGEGLRVGDGATAFAGPVGPVDESTLRSADLLLYVRTHGTLVGTELGDLSIAQDRESTLRLYGGDQDLGRLLGAVR